MSRYLQSRIKEVRHPKPPPTGSGYHFPSVEGGIEFEGVSPWFIPNIQVQKVDPISRTGEIADFNREQNRRNLTQGLASARDLLAAEFEGLQTFNRQARGLQREAVGEENAFNTTQFSAANAFNRTQIPIANDFNMSAIAEANAFNQAQRLTQLDAAIPGAKDILKKGLKRGSTLSEGRFLSEIEDRAFEAAARNASADSSMVRGFGDDSVFGRKASDLLSAEQRLQLSQMGEQTTGRYLQLASSLAFDQPIKHNPVIDQPLKFQPQTARTAQDIMGRPERAASTLAAEQESMLSALTSIAPAQAIGFDVNQNQFQANLDQATNQFNSQLDFNAQKFNSTMALQVALEELAIEAWNAQQEAGAINATMDRADAQSNYNSALELGQNASMWNAVGQIGGMALPSILNGLFNTGGGSNGTGSGGGNIFQRAYDAITGGDEDVQGGSSTRIPTMQFEEEPTVDVPGGDVDSGYGGPTVSVGDDFSFSEIGGEDFDNDFGNYSIIDESDSSIDFSTYDKTAKSFYNPSDRPQLMKSLVAPDPVQQGQDAQQARFVSDVGTLAYNSYRYFDNFDRMNNTQRGFGGAQLGAAALAIGGVSDAAPAAGVIGAVGQGVNMAMNWDRMNDIQRGMAVSRFAGSTLMASSAVTGAIGLAAGLVLTALTPFIGEAFGGNKPGHQRVRDSYRGYGEEIGLFQEGNKQNGLPKGQAHVRLANGNYYNVSKDGEHKLQNYGTNIDGKTERFTYDIDWSDPRAQDSVSMLNPVSLLIFGDNYQKMMGHMWNAATSNNRSLSETAANIRTFAQDAGLDYQSGLRMLDQYRQRKVIDESTHRIFVAQWNQVMLNKKPDKEIVV